MDRVYVSKETYIYEKRPTKETCKRDLQNRRVKETHEVSATPAISDIETWALPVVETWTGLHVKRDLRI